MGLKAKFVFSLCLGTKMLEEFARLLNNQWAKRDLASMMYVFDVGWAGDIAC